MIVRILKILEKEEFDLAQELIEWIKKNGGNYHVMTNPIRDKKNDYGIFNDDEIEPDIWGHLLIEDCHKRLKKSSIE